jgi:hypothetical protein
MKGKIMKKLNFKKVNEILCTNVAGFETSQAKAIFGQRKNIVKLANEIKKAQTEKRLVEFLSDHMPSLVEPSKKKENVMIQKRSGSFKNYVGFFLNIASNNDIILNMPKTSNISSLYGLNKLIQDTNNPKNKTPKNTKKGNSKNEAKNEDQDLPNIDLGIDEIVAIVQTNFSNEEIYTLVDKLRMIATKNHKEAINQ